MEFVPKFENELQESVLRDVSIQESGIPGAGMGAFWKGDWSLPKGRRVAIYAGVKLKRCPLDVKYVLELADDVYICARNLRHSNWTRFINDVRGTALKPNLAFTTDGRLVTLRVIHPGEEFFVSYGASYWDDEK